MNYREKYSVNPAAESTLNTLAIVLHILGIVAAILVFIMSINSLQEAYEVSRYYDYDYGYGRHYQPSVPFSSYLIVFISSIFIYVFGGLLPWAVIKVVVNMSRTVMNVAGDVEDIKITLEKQSQSPHVPQGPTHVQ